MRGLDEMQKGQRNHIGNQMFMVMFYALMLNGGLPAFGLRWLDYPSSVMVIITICMSVYLVRVIAMNAYLPLKAQKKKTVVVMVLSVIFSITLAIAMVKLFGPTQQLTEPADNNSAVILMIASTVALISILITALVKKANNKNLSDD
jgi:hypothetical protein